MVVGKSEIVQPLAAGEINSLLDKFLQSFDKNDLDAVMEFFTDNSVYQVLQGGAYVGKSAIRKAFERQFVGAYGLLYFRETQRIIDEKQGTAALLWDCEHLLDQGPSARGINLLTRYLLKLRYRKRCHWQGLDVFTINPEGKISSKRTYGHALVPRLHPGVQKDSPYWEAR
ncbi:MAG: YybH family protein [Mycobacteriaceae bacterium]